MNPLSMVTAHNFPAVYKALDIDLSNMGCIMLNTAPIMVSDIIAADDLYYSENEDHKYVNGIVSETVPHITLLYGLLESGETYKPYVDAVLKGWNITHVGIDNVGFFESPYDDEAYYCLVAHIIPSVQLVEGNARLQFLPHINTFLNYDPHVTLAYIKKDIQKRDDYIAQLNNKLVLKKLATQGINYGD